MKLTEFRNRVYSAGYQDFRLKSGFWSLALGDVILIQIKGTNNIPIMVSVASSAAERDVEYEL